MTTFIAFVLVFGLIVFVHEFGHFALAKANGIVVHEFALGMGPAIFTKKGKETTYAIRAFPIGGYVRMEGEEEASELSGSFSEKNPWQRLSVIFAGPVMNFVLAVVLLVIVFFTIGFPSTLVNEVVEGGPADLAGITRGDRVLSLDGQPIDDWSELVASIEGTEGAPFTLTIERDGMEDTLTLEAAFDEEVGRYLIGISPRFEKSPGRSITMAFEEVKTLTLGIFDFLAALPRGEVKGELVGPVGIVSLVGEAAGVGVMNVLYLAAYISINLGIVNLLPFPALDGGRILFILVEILKGSPVDPEKERYVHTVGFILLIGLMLFMVFRDVMRIGAI